MVEHCSAVQSLAGANGLDNQPEFENQPLCCEAQ